MILTSCLDLKDKQCEDQDQHSTLTLHSSLDCMIKRTDEIRHFKSLYDEESHCTYSVMMMMNCDDDNDDDRERKKERESIQREIKKKYTQCSKEKVTLYSN